MTVEEEFELTADWFVGKRKGPEKRPDASSYKAFYCLKWGEEIIDRKEFTKQELEVEIDRLRRAGEDSTDHEKALRKFSMAQQA